MEHRNVSCNPRAILPFHPILQWKPKEEKHLDRDVISPHRSLWMTSFPVQGAFFLPFVWYSSNEKQQSLGWFPGCYSQ